MQKNVTIPTHTVFNTLISMNHKDICGNQMVKYLEKEINITSKYSTKLNIKLGNHSPPEEKKLFMSANEIILYLICFDYYYNNYKDAEKDGFIFIKIGTINRYRNITKTTKELVAMYKIAFSNLANKEVAIGFDLEECKRSYVAQFGETLISEPLIDYSEVYSKAGNVHGFNIRFNKLFKLILKSKQTTQMPISFLQIKPNQILRLNIAVLLESYLRSNYSKTSKTIAVKTLMRNIPFYTEHNRISAISILDKVKLKDVSSYKIITKFSKTLLGILDTLKKVDPKLKDYNLSEIKIKNFEDMDISVTLLINSNNKSKGKIRYKKKQV